MINRNSHKNGFSFDTTPVDTPYPVNFDFPSILPMVAYPVNFDFPSILL